MPSKSQHVLHQYDDGWGEGIPVCRRGWIKQGDPKFPRVSFLVGWSGGYTQGNFLNQESRRSHLGSFCNAIKVSNLPECSFTDVSEEKDPIYSMLLNVFEVECACSVECAYVLASRQLWVWSSHPAHFFVEIWS